MAYMQRLSVIVVLGGIWCLPVFAQGMLPRWEVETLAKSLEEHASKLEQVLAQVRPKEWTQAGASEAYLEQYETLTTELGHLGVSAQNLGRNPEKISVVVDTFLWLDRLGSMLRSMSEGTRRYQNAALADLLDSAVSSNSGAEASLKSYMRDLAVQREAEMEIAHNEAQRCREDLFKGRPRRN
jgi:hypothetical protein